MSFIRPPALRPQDKVAVIAPAGPFDRDRFEAGLEILSGRYRPAFDPGIFSQHRYLAGDDARRHGELSAALADPSIAAVFAARGGYGTMRLLPRLSLGSPKLVVGFSDITSLHLAIQRAGWTSIHGPVLTQLGTQAPEVSARLFQLLEVAAPGPPLTGGTCVVPGTVDGPLLGGNLSVFTRLLGTRFLPPLDGAILLLEDVGERPYRLDRMWTHLSLAGAFDRLTGIVLGDFSGCEEQSASYSSAEVLSDLARETGLPCAMGFPIGHGALNLPVPLGVRARLDAQAGSVCFLEPAVSSELRP